MIDDAAASTGLARRRIEVLFERYGATASTYFATLRSGGETLLTHLPSYSHQEIAFIATRERVSRLQDVLLRRTSIALLGDATVDVISEVGLIVATALGWSDGETASEIAATSVLLADRYAVKRA